MGDMKGVYRVWRRDLMEGDLFENLGAGWEDYIKMVLQ
jgi:hypothetical protein